MIQIEVHTIGTFCEDKEMSCDEAVKCFSNMEIFMEVLQMVLLAKSYKPGGRCLAGKLVEYTDKSTVKVGGWVRPVANDGSGHGALTERIYLYEDGSEASILDIVEIPVIRHFPIAGQPENYVVDESKKWKKIGTLNANCIPRITENAPDIWNDTNTQSNIVTAGYDQKGLISQSLYLIKPSNFLITLSNEFNDYEQSYKRKIVASFSYSGRAYRNISVTCPSAKRILTNQYPKEGRDPITIPLRKGDDYVLCMSLSPRFGNDENHYKLVATIFDFDGYLQREYAA